MSAFGLALERVEYVEFLLRCGLISEEQKLELNQLTKDMLLDGRLAEIAAETSAEAWKKAT